MAGPELSREHGLLQGLNGFDSDAAAATAAGAGALAQVQVALGNALQREGGVAAGLRAGLSSAEGSGACGEMCGWRSHRLRVAR